MKRFYERHHLSKEAVTKPSSVVETLSTLKTRGSRYFCVFDQIPDPGRYAALELGFGYPQISNALASVFGDYLAVDIAADAILAAGRDEVNFKYLAADLNVDFPIESESKDVLIAMMVIEHLFDPFHSFSEIARICRRGGMVFVNLPLITSLKHRMALLAGRLPVTSTKNWFELREWDGGHLHYFDVPHVRRIGELYGLNLVRMYPVGHGYHLKRLLPRLLCGEMSFVFRRN